MQKHRLLTVNANYRNLWLASSGSILGDWFNQVALGMVTLSLTQSPSAMGLILLCRSLPAVIVGPFVSPLIDRCPKRAILLISDLARAAFVLFFPLALLLQQLFLLYIGALFVGLSGVMFAPAQQAAFPLIVPAKDLVRANTLNAGTSGLLSILGAAGGGIVSSFLNPTVCFMINSLSYLWSALCIFRIHFTEHKSENYNRLTYVSALKQGLEAVLHNRAARSIIFIGMSWGFAGGGYAILIPTLGDIVYQMGGFGIGLLYAVDGLGVLLGAVFVQRFVGSSARRANRCYGLAYLMQALFFTLMAQSNVFAVGVLMLLLMRFHSGIIIPLDSYLMQMYTRREVRGRVFALHTATYSGVMQLSYALFGYLFESFGIPVMGAIIGLISFLCGLFWFGQEKMLRAEKG